MKKVQSIQNFPRARNNETWDLQSEGRRYLANEQAGKNLNNFAKTQVYSSRAQPVQKQVSRSCNFFF